MKTKDDMSTSMVYCQQSAAAAKTVGILAKQSNQIAEQFLSVKYFIFSTFSIFLQSSCLTKPELFVYAYLIKLQVVTNLLGAMGNEEYADAQRQASKTLEVKFKLMIANCKIAIINIFLL